MKVRPARFLSLLMLAPAFFADAQRMAQPSVTPLQVTSIVPASVAPVLRDLASRAGVIFTGTVLSVTRTDETGFVDIAFRIEYAVRGCPHTGTYVLREWAGLWTAGDARYRKGQHLLLLLSARGPSGLSAPVGGMAGIIPLVPTRQPPLLHGSNIAPAEIPAEAGDPGASLAADLRWVQILGMRPVASVAPGSRAEHLLDDPVQSLPADPSLRDAGWRGPVQALRPEASAGDLPGLRAVLALLGQTTLLPVATHEAP